MKPADAEKRLGGYAAGTLTEAERQGLFAAALEHQEVFDALADEEALRDLLADPATRAQLLVALSPAAAPKPAALPRVVPFWRRTGVLGAAASLLVAATAGLAYLRSPGKVPPPLASPKGSASKVLETPPPAPQPMAAPVMAATAPQEDSARWKERSKVQDAKKVEAPKPAAMAVMEEVVAPKEEAPRRANQAPVTTLADLPPARSAAGALAGLARGAAAPAPAAMAKTKADRRSAEALSRGSAPARWTLGGQPDGSTAVEVWAPRNARLVLLKRGPGGVAVIGLQPHVQPEASGEAIPWRCEVRLEAGEALDLYLLNHPVADPSKLPETGPFDGFRARIHPTAKKDSEP